jgi:hypothetical protein
MDDLLGWATVAALVAIPVAFVVIALVTRFRPHDDEGRGGAPLGGLLGVDEIFHPSGAEGRAAWEAQQQILVPAPSPDRGPGVIEAGTRIVVEVPHGH